MKLNLIEFLRLYNEKSFLLRNVDSCYEKDEYLEIDFEKSAVFGAKFGDISSITKYSFNDFSNYFVVSFRFDRVMDELEITVENTKRNVEKC